MRGKTLINRWMGWGLVLLLAVMISGRAHADKDRHTQEIQHLMGYIAGSSCQFIRNGKTYDAEAAQAHIQKKYDHVRRRIRTTEDFIRYAASQSSMSGKPYRIRCGDETMLCADWLHAELRRFRRTE